MLRLLPHHVDLHLRRLASLLVIPGALSLAGCAALPTPGPFSARDGVLVDTAGRSLYVFDRDVAGSNDSACRAECLRNWPLLDADEDSVFSSHWTVIKRSDGLWQWAYKGRPLYRYAKDSRPGDRAGDGVNGVWHLARP